MTTVRQSMLVGMHFRPPAKTLLASLPAGTVLGLRPEPTNPYDEKAIEVFLSPDNIPESQHATLEATLPSQGSTLEEIFEHSEWKLGYVAASGGKPLQGSDLDGNAEWLSLVLAGARSATLGFSVEGKPLLTLVEAEVEYDESGDFEEEGEADA